MSNERLDLLLQYSLALAGQEDYGNRELGPIHLIKYAYLGDLAYAQTHSGQVFTDVPWRFFHFGPWAEIVATRIPEALQAIGAHERSISGSRFGEFIRWSLTDAEPLRQLEQQIPAEVGRALRRVVHEYGSDTEGLLHYVYRTAPMLRAAPGEPLNFASAARPPVDIDGPQVPVLAPTGALPTLSNTKRRELQARVRTLLESFKPSSGRSPEPPPRYDGLHEEGLRWLDSLAGDSPSLDSQQVEFSEDIWKSRGRGESDLP